MYIIDDDRTNSIHSEFEAMWARCRLKFLSYHFQPSNEMYVVSDKRRNPIDFDRRFKGQGLIWDTTCEALWV